MELNDDISELKDSIEEVLVIITPEMCRHVMLSVRRCLELCVQSGGQYFEDLCKVTNLRFREGGTPISKSGAISAKTAPFLKKGKLVSLLHKE